MLEFGQCKIFSRSDLPNCFAIVSFTCEPRRLCGNSLERELALVIDNLQSLEVFHTWTASANHVSVVRDRVERFSLGHRKALAMVMNGTSNKVIAVRLDVGERTIENRRQGIAASFGARSMTEVAELVFETIGLAEIVIEE